MGPLRTGLIACSLLAAWFVCVACGATRHVEPTEAQAESGAANEVSRAGTAPGDSRGASPQAGTGGTAAVPLQIEANPPEDPAPVPMPHAATPCDDPQPFALGG